MVAGSSQSNLVEPLVRRLASQVFATEAFAFAESDQSRGRLELVCHIRHDQAGPGTIDAARKAAEQLLEPCLRQSKDGAIQISAAEASEPNPQFALITLLRDQRNAARIIGAILIITRCTDDQDARQRLRMLQG